MAAEDGLESLPSETGYSSNSASDDNNEDKEGTSEDLCTPRYGSVKKPFCLNRDQDQISLIRSPENVRTRYESCHDLGGEGDKKLVHIFIESILKEYGWDKHVLNAISDICVAAPGIEFREVPENEVNHKFLIRVYAGMYGSYGSESKTYSNIWECELGISEMVHIYLACKEIPNNMKRVSLHELMHALGFEHEHQREDGKKYMNYPESKKIRRNIHKYVSENFLPKNDYYGLTDFDPLSIMLNEEMESLGFIRKEDNPAWKIKAGETSANEKLSELDKYSLNIMFRPCATKDYYIPVLNASNGMYYCDREVMLHHNYPDNSLARDNLCQKGGPNCPACRTLSFPTENGIKITDKEQGSSGFVYCGKQFEPNMVCGPHIGWPCEDCQKIINS